MSSVWLRVRIPFVLALVSMLVTALVEKTFSANSIVIALLFAVAGFMYEILISVEEMKREVGISFNVMREKSDIFRKYATQEVANVKKLFDNLSKKTIICNSKEHLLSVYYDLLSKGQPGSSLRATSPIGKSLSTLDYIWQADEGSHAIEQNRIFIQRGGRVQRIFMLWDESQENDTRVREELLRHKKIGCDVRIAFVYRMDPWLRRDLAIFDKPKAVLEVTVDANGTFVRGELSVDDDKYNELEAIFESILNRAREPTADIPGD